MLGYYHQKKLQDSRFKIQDVYCSKHKICARNILQIIDYTTDKNIIAVSQKHYKLDINSMIYSASLAKSLSLQLLNNENNLNTGTGLLWLHCFKYLFRTWL